jgi:hypothetical protein
MKLFAPLGPVSALKSLLLKRLPTKSLKDEEDKLPFFYALNQLVP